MKINFAKSFCEFKYTCTHVIYIFRVYNVCNIYQYELIDNYFITHMPYAHGNNFVLQKMYINASEI